VSRMPGFSDLEDAVINKGLCTACGTCAGICPSVCMGEEDEEPMPILCGDCDECGICVEVCPGAKVPLLAMEEKVFGRKRSAGQPDYGVYRQLGYGYAEDNLIRNRGSSGGVVTAIFVYALEKGLIDAALVAGFDSKRPWRTAARVATSREELVEAAQSKYASTPVNQLLLEASESNKKLGVVGLPCQVQALRKIQLKGIPVKVSSAISLIIGLFCASQFYFQGTRHLLAELGGVDNPEKLKEVSYRGGGWPGHLVGKDGKGRPLEIGRHSYMYHLLLPGYKRDRCEMCLDWSSELADISAGDYWPRHGGKGGGYTAVIIRSEVGQQVFTDAVADGQVNFTPLPDGEPSIASSIGYEMKKHAAAFRLRQRQRFGWPVPEYDYMPDYRPWSRSFHFAPEKKE